MSDAPIDPDGFLIPPADPETLEVMAHNLRNDGETLAGVGHDIKNSWGGLRDCYSAPEAETLYAVVDPVATDGDTVSTGMADAASALEAFAEKVREIKGKWTTLEADSRAFLSSIEGDDDWREADGFIDGLLGRESDKVEENRALIERANALQEEYEEAERACANAINADIPNRTRFVAGDGDGGPPAPGVYEHGYDDYTPDMDMPWGSAAETDHGWWVDAGSAVKDYVVGIGEDLGGMTGMYSSEGWFEASWGDALYEYHEGNLQSLGSLVGMYDSESDGWGWSGWDTVGNAWKDAAHAVVPWEEWGDRPGYVIGTALLNIGATVGGAVLTATGVGAVVGVPLMAWRGSAMLNKMGGDGPSTPDTSMPDLSTLNLPSFGDGSGPRLNLNLDRLTEGAFSPSQLSEMRTLLERLKPQNLLGSGAGDGADTGGFDSGRNDTGTSNARRIPVGYGDDGGDNPSNHRRPVNPTAQNLADTDRFMEIVDNPENADFGRDVTQRYQDEIAENDRDAKTRPGGSGSWEANEIESDRPDGGFENEPALVRTGGGDTLEAEAGAPRNRDDQVLGDRSVIDTDGLNDLNDLNDRFDEVVGGQFDNDGPRMQDRTHTVTNSTGSIDGLGDPRGGTDVLERPVDGDGGTVSGGSGNGGDTGGSGGGGGNPGGDDRGDRGPGGGDDDRRRPTTAEEFRAHSWGDKNDPANQQALLDDLQRLLNEEQEGREYNDFYREFYKENNGHRKSADTVVGAENWELPRISRADNGDWIPLKPAEAPDYLGDRTELRLDDPDFMPERRDDLPDNEAGRAEAARIEAEIARREQLQTDLGGLDSLAVRRRMAIDEAMRASDHLKDMEDKYGKYKENSEDNHPLVEAAKRDYREAQSHSTDLSEVFGEMSARYGARFEFDGSTALDKNGDPVMKPVLDQDGNRVYENGVLKVEELVRPNLEGATEIKPSPFAPKNGNDQFDQIYRTVDGDIVIIEAKSSTTTDLGERKITQKDGKPRLVSQGTRAYLEDILRAMGERGKKPGNIAERKLAKEIREKLEQGRVAYAVFKGDPVDVYERNDRGNYVKDDNGKRVWTGESTANGYEYQIFDLSKKAS